MQQKSNLSSFQSLALGLIPPKSASEKKLFSYSIRFKFLGGILSRGNLSDTYTYYEYTIMLMMANQERYDCYVAFNVIFATLTFVTGKLWS